MAHPVLAGQVAGLRRPGLLPAEANGFVGRASELLWLTTQLRSARLVTVVGPGGVGKTRLCLRAAASLPPTRFPDGIWIVELSALSDPMLLADAVAAASGCRSGTRRTATATARPCSSTCGTGACC